MPDPDRLIPLVRAWAVLIFGSAAITFGLLESRGDLLVVGFSVLGAEPMTQAGKTVASNGRG